MTTGTDQESRSGLQAAAYAVEMCTPETLDEFVGFIAEQNGSPSNAQHCLHFDRTLKTVRDDLAWWEIEPSRDLYGFRAAGSDSNAGESGSKGPLIGLVGCTSDGLNHVHGPWVRPTQDSQVDDILRRVILDELRQRAPQCEQHTFILFLDERSERPIRTAIQAGYERNDNISYNLEIVKDPAAGEPWVARAMNSPKKCTVRLVDISETKCRESVDMMQREYFPNRSIKLEKLDGKDGWLFCCFPLPNDNPTSDTTIPIGYALVDRQSESMVYVEFLGVRKDFRGIGVGRTLLNSIREWFEDDAALNKIHLTVESNNAHAKALYESVGFNLLYAGVSLKLRVDA